MRSLALLYMYVFIRGMAKTFSGESSLLLLFGDHENGEDDSYLH